MQVHGLPGLFLRARSRGTQLSTGVFLGKRGQPPTLRLVRAACEVRVGQADVVLGLHVRLPGLEMVGRPAVVHILWLQNGSLWPGLQPVWSLYGAWGGGPGGLFPARWGHVPLLNGCTLTAIFTLAAQPIGVTMLGAGAMLELVLKF